VMNVDAIAQDSASVTATLERLSDWNCIEDHSFGVGAGPLARCPPID